MTSILDTLHLGRFFSFFLSCVKGGLKCNDLSQSIQGWAEYQTVCDHYYIWVASVLSYFPFLLSKTCVICQGLLSILTDNEPSHLFQKRPCIIIRTTMQQQGPRKCGCSCTHSPAPTTLHPQPCTHSPAPAALHPQPCTQSPALTAMHPQLCTHRFSKMATFYLQNSLWTTLFRSTYLLSIFLELNNMHSQLWISFENLATSKKIIKHAAPQCRTSASQTTLLEQCTPKGKIFGTHYK